MGHTARDTEYLSFGIREGKGGNVEHKGVPCFAEVSTMGKKEAGTYTVVGTHCVRWRRTQTSAQLKSMGKS
jgi:hypothetical protein